MVFEEKKHFFKKPSCPFFPRSDPPPPLRVPGCKKSRSSFLNISLSGLQGRIRPKIYDGQKKYFGLTNVSFQCHTSSWNTHITIRKWFQNFTKVSGSPILCLPILVKIAVFRWQKIGLPETFVKFWNHFLIVIGVFQDDVWHWNETFVNPKYFFRPSYIFGRILPCNPFSKCK